MGIFTLIGIIVVVFWLLGLIAHIGGAFINILLVIGVVFLVLNFFKGNNKHTDV